MSPQHNSTLRIGIISDTHGIIDPNVVDAIKDCDQIIHAGDICSARVVEHMHQLSDKVTAVAGNNDASGLWPIEDTHVVNSLPHMAEIELPGGKLAIEHGHRHGMHQPCHNALRHSHPDARMVVYGHTHSMLIDKDHTPWVVNPGAAGHTRTRGGSSCLILTVSGDQWDIEMLRFPEQTVD